MSEEFDHIHYKKCPHFTVGHVDQWGESGYLLFEGEVYSYTADRHEQFDTIRNRMSIEKFVAHADKMKIEIPERFQKEMDAL